jgi:hypothetical protein
MKLKPVYTKTLVLVASAILSSGCQSTYKSDSDYKQEALSNAPLLTQSYAQNLIDSHQAIKLSTDFTQGHNEYRRQVFGSIATQQAQLAGTPTFARFKVKLTQSMYKGDIDAFVVPFNTVQINEKGDLQDFKVTVIMTNNLWADHYSKSMNYATWNEMALKGITIASLSDKQEVDRMHADDPKMRLFYNLRTPVGIYLPEHSNDEYFSTDKRTNSEWLDHFFRKGGNDSERGLTQFIKANSEEAKSLVGKDVTAIISVLSVFKVGKTGQYIVIGNPMNSLLLDNNGRESSGHIEKMYHWSDLMEESMLRFDKTNTVPYM